MKLLVSGVWIVLSLLCAGCGPSAQQKAALNENQKLKVRVKALEEQALREESEGRIARNSLREIREASSKKEQEVTTERETLKKQLDEVKKAFDAYRSKYRVTARAPGQKLVRLDCGNGKIFENVEITEVSPGELSFRHAHGSGRVPLGMLEPSLRDRLDYDAEEAAVWLEANRPKVLAMADPGLAKDVKLSAAKEWKLKAETDTKAKQYNNLRRRYVADLNSIYSSARSLQADRNCCPVHKRYQLASWAEEAAKLKSMIAALPSQ